jgi:hypothetical protein
MKLRVADPHFAVCRLPSGAESPSIQGSFVALTRTAEELSLVCEERLAPFEAKVEGGWRLLRVSGTLDFSQVGVLAALCVPLAEAGVSIFAISTFDTDYLLLKDSHLDRAIAALGAAGHTFESD